MPKKNEIKLHISPFWRDQRRDALYSKLSEAIIHCGGDIENVSGFVISYKPSIFDMSFVASNPTYKRYFDNSSGKINARFLTGLLFAAVEAIKNKYESIDYCRENFVELHRLYVDILRENPILTRKTGNIDDVGEFVNRLFSFLKITKEDVSALPSALFFSNTKNRRFFITYRFSSAPGKIQKSLTIITKRKIGAPVTFTNAYKSDGGDRITRGIVMPFGSQIVFAGNVDGDAIKVMVMRKFRQPRDRYFGILITNEADGEIVSGRFSMIETEYTNHKEIGKYLVTTDEIPSEHMDLVERIRNRVDFCLEKTYYDKNDEEIDEKDILSNTATLLREEKDIYYIENGQKKFYNPADRDSFTFNSALGLKK